MSLAARAGRVVVTPAVSGPLGGYVARGDALSSGTRDELEAAMLVLDDGDGGVVALVTLDAIAVTTALADRLRASVRDGLGAADLPVLVTASHSHSAPLSWVGSIHPGHPGHVDEGAVDQLARQVGSLAEALRQRSAVAVHASWHHARAIGLGTNRNDPSRPHDDGVGVLALRAETGLLALVVDAATHPTVLGADNVAWSADWPGAMRARVLGELAGQAAPPVLLFLQGAAGDVSTRFTRRPNATDEVERLGRLAGDAVLEALASDGVPLHGPVRHRSEEILLRRRSLPGVDDADRELDGAQRLREELVGNDPASPRVRLAQVRLDGAMMQRAMVSAGLPDEVPIRVSALAVGGVGWVFLPLEPFTEVGAAIRAGSPSSTTRVIGYTDGYRGYLVDREAEASASYEARSSLFAAASADDVVAAATRVLRAAARGEGISP